MAIKTSTQKPETKNLDGCSFCKKRLEPDYKDYKDLMKFITERARIVGRAKSGVCSKHQRKLTREIKRARYLGLLPYTPNI